MFRFAFLALFGLGASLACGPLCACNVPVFRYAFERWRADNYEYLVFHRGPLSESARAAANSLRAISQDGSGQANFELRMCDAVGPLAPEQAALYKLVGEPQEPFLVVRSPAGKEDRFIVHRGPLNAAEVARVSNSPARKEVLNRLFNGDAIVWVWTPGSDAEKNKQLAELLAALLPTLQKSIRLPEGIGADGFNLLTNIPLEVKFSVLEVRRDQVEEDAFLKQLLAPAPDLANHPGPICFPMFGRGRVLAALAKEDLTADRLREAVEFLCGACSCHVKELNPGYDVVLSADWESLFDRVSAASESAQTLAAALPPDQETKGSAATPRQPIYVPIPVSPSAPKATSAAETIVKSNATHAALFHKLTSSRLEMFLAAILLSLSLAGVAWNARRYLS